MIKILCIGPQDVSSLVDGGKQSIAGALSGLAQENEVFYAFPKNTNGSVVDIECYANIGVTSIPFEANVEETFLFRFISTLRLRSYKFDKYSRKRNALSLLKRFNNYNIVPDIILCHHPHTVELGAYVRKYFPKAQLFLREHNLEFEIVKTYSKGLGVFLKLIGILMSIITKKHEKRVWEKVDATFFMSPSDYKKALDLFPKVRSKLYLANEGINVVPIEPKSKHNNKLLFLLNPKASQNIVNAKIFMENYWIPYVTSNSLIPDGKLIITSVSIEEFSLMTGIPVNYLKQLKIEFPGFVMDVNALIVSCIATVSPVFVGAGMRIKNLKSMALGIPVLATDLDIETNDNFKQDINILSMNTYQEFVNSLESLQNEEFRKSISMNARSLMVSEFSWSRFTKEIISVYKNGLKSS